MSETGIKNMKEGGDVAEEVKCFFGTDTREGRIAYNIIVLLSAYSLTGAKSDEARMVIDAPLNDLVVISEEQIEIAKRIAGDNLGLVDELYRLACI